ncbi:MAG: hypothetical protein JNL38_05055 [Myxococcales bacterium]|nr:hypothetical protein [Myxococcales bacterium]
MTRARARAAGSWLAVAAVLGASSSPAADAPPSVDEEFGLGAAALAAEKPEEAIGRFEALADRGVVDAAASFDRGLAYASRFRKSPRPGDLGRAIQGFEEARSLTADPARERAASAAIVLLRSEVARRRAAAGDAPYVQPGPPAVRLVLRSLPEDAWTVLAALSSLALTAGLFVRWRASGRVRLGGAGVAASAGGLLAITALAAWAARDERLTLTEGVTVAENVRATDEGHAPIASEAPIAEGTRLEILATRDGWTEVQLPSRRAWITSAAIVPLVRPAR